MPLPPQLSDLLGAPLSGATRLVVRHRRRRTFRWIVLLELLFGFLLFLCLLPFLLLFSLLTQNMPDDGAHDSGTSWSERFFNDWHDLDFAALNNQQQTLGQVSHRCRGAAEGDAILASTLLAADQQGVMVIELLGDGAGETAEVWFGGRPLLAHVHTEAEADARAALERIGYTLSMSGPEVLIRRHEPAASRIGAFFLLSLLLALLPILFWKASCRRAIGLLWADLLGTPPAARELALSAASLTLTWRRGARSERLAHVEGRDLLGLAFGPSLGFDRAVSRLDPTVRLICRDRAVVLPPAFAEEGGRHLRDFLVAATLRLRAERPELGLAGDRARPTRCPWCGALYVFTAQSPCPNCGGWPESVV